MHYMQFVRLFLLSLAFVVIQVSLSEAQTPIPEKSRVTITVTATCSTAAGSTQLTVTGEGLTENDACLDGQRKIQAGHSECKRIIFDQCPPASLYLYSSEFSAPQPYLILYCCTQSSGQETCVTESGRTLSEAICNAKFHICKLGLSCCCSTVQILKQPCIPAKHRLFRCLR